MIHLSRAALLEVKRLQRRSFDKTSNAILRLSVQTGGCSDFYYTLEFAAEPAAGDRLWHCDDGLQVAVDASSLRYLDGLTLDYSEDLMGGGFRFDNPNAEEHCGCGNSFKAIEPLTH